MIVTLPMAATSVVTVWTIFPLVILEDTLPSRVFFTKLSRGVLYLALVNHFFSKCNLLSNLGEINVLENFILLRNFQSFIVALSLECEVGRLSQKGVETILNSIFGAIYEELFKVDPLRPVLLVKSENLEIFIFFPLFLFGNYWRRKIVNPPFSDLLAVSGLNFVRSSRPVAFAVDSNELFEFLVFL